MGWAHYFWRRRHRLRNCGRRLGDRRRAHHRSPYRREDAGRAEDDCSRRSLRQAGRHDLFLRSGPGYGRSGLAADVALNALPSRPPAAPPPPATAPQPADVPPPAKLVLSDVGSAVNSALDAATSPSPVTAPEPVSVPQPPSPPHAGPELTKSAPLPSSRLPVRAQEKHGAVRSADRRAAPQAIAAAVNPAPADPDNRNFFQKLFDMPQQPSGPVLAYAQPEDGSISSRPAYNASVAVPPSDGNTAIYDIAAHTVYMPNGERLEAHSGLGNRLDDPSHVNEKIAAQRRLMFMTLRCGGRSSTVFRRCASPLSATVICMAAQASWRILTCSAPTATRTDACPSRIIRSSCKPFRGARSNALSSWRI